MDIRSDSGSTLRLRLLSDAGAVLAEERDLRRMLQRLARTVVETLADAAIVYLVEGNDVRRAVRVHRDPDRVWLLDRLEEIAPLRRGTPAVDRILGSGESVFVPPAQLEAWAENREHLEILRELDVQSALFVPMAGRTGVVGVLAAATVGDGRPPLDEDDATVVSELGRRAALVLENERFHEEIARHARRMEALAAASHAFSEVALDSDALLERIARAVAGSIGDFCSVRLVSSDGERMRLAAMHHPDEEARRMLRALSTPNPPSAREGLFGRVVEGGEEVVELSSDPDEIRRLSPPSVRPYHDRRPVHAVLVVPMRIADRTIGALTAWRERPDDPYVEHDRILLRDLADQAALSVENLRLFEEARAASEAKSRFLSLMSHELRTPVNAAMGYADLLSMEVGGPLTDEQARSVERIEDACRVLARLMDELIAYADLETEETSLEPVPTTLAPHVEGAVSEVERDAAAKGLFLSVSVPEGIEMVVDPGRLRSLLLNLLTNAVRFTDTGGVSVEADRIDDSVAIRVIDTGRGVDPADQDRIFTSFWQVADPHTRDTGGMGIGLSVTRRLARRLGGDVEVESEPGRGSTFVLTLPLSPGKA